jgi:hypothetical protein
VNTTSAERRAAEHAGLWKATLGKPPHYSRALFSAGWTCFACPLDNCEWHHDEPVSHPSDPAELETRVREHLESHALADFLSSLQTARDVTTAVQQSSDRAWDVVSLHRLRAIHRGEHPTTDPVAQMLSAALVGTAEHEDVRRELTALSEGVAGAQNIASASR